MNLADHGGILDGQCSSRRDFVRIGKGNPVNGRGIDDGVGDLDRHAWRATQPANDARINLHGDVRRDRRPRRLIGETGSPARVNAKPGTSVQWRRRRPRVATAATDCTRKRPPVISKPFKRQLRAGVEVDMPDHHPGQSSDDVRWRRGSSTLLRCIDRNRQGLFVAPAVADLDNAAASDRAQRVLQTAVLTSPRRWQRRRGQNSCAARIRRRPWPC